MLKRIFLAAMFSLILFVGSQASAEMPASEMSLGGLTIGFPMDIVRKAYGEPTSEQSENGIDSCTYGNSVRIDYNIYTGGITSVVVSAPNGWKTPAGLGVGMNILDALDLYGNPDYTETGDLKTAYAYFHWAHDNSTQENYRDYGLILIVNIKRGTILQIKLLSGNSTTSFEEGMTGKWLNHLTE